MDSDVKFVVIVACLAFLAVPLAMVVKHCKPKPKSTRRVKRYMISMYLSRTKYYV